MKKKIVEVFKLQKPILTNDDYLILAYNKDRSIRGQFPPTEELLEMFGDEMKIYVIASYNEKTEQIEIVKKTTEDMWNVDWRTK